MFVFFFGSHLLSGVEGKFGVSEATERWVWVRWKCMNPNIHLKTYEKTID